MDLEGQDLYAKFLRDEESIQTILAEHPEVKILWEKRGQFPGPIEINGVNPIFHVLIEGIIENQIKDGDPPEAREAFFRLQNMGLTSHAARGAIAALFIPHFTKVLREKAPFDRKMYSRRLKILGADLRSTGRNQSCPCGSGRKYKKCCLPVAEFFTPRKNAGALVLGCGSYATPDYLLSLDPEAITLQIENRVHIAHFLEAQGDLTGALACLRENAAQVEQNENLLTNALQDILHLCFNHRELSAEGIKAVDRLIDLTGDEEQKGMYRCDRADLRAAAGQVEQAEKEYQAIFNDFPNYKFARYRYALFLDQYGRSDEAEAVLTALLERPAEVDPETYRAAREVLEDLRRSRQNGETKERG